MKALLDSSFIISCVRERIDFLDQLKEQGFDVVVPREVIQEMKDLRNRNKTSHVDRTAIDIALQLLDERKVKKTGMGEGKVDDWLVKKGAEGFYIATLDNAVKRAVPYKIVIFRAEGKVGVR